MRTQLVTISLTMAATIAVIGTTEPVAAQRAAEAKAFDPAAGADLARKSIDFLRQAEDSTDPVAKADLYRHGLELARQAVTADDSNADAHFALFANMGRVMLAEGATPNPVNLLQVNRELERALELDPHHSDALAAKGGLYRQLPALLGGSYVKAERCLEESIAIDPNAVGARIELAHLYRDTDRAAQAIELARTASALARQMGKKRQLGEASRLLAELEAHH